MSLIVLSALIYLPKNEILIFSCVVIFGHNLLDHLNPKGSFLWGCFRRIESKARSPIYLNVPLFQGPVGGDLESSFYVLPLVS